MTLSPKQAQSVRDATRRVNVWDGSIRSGKTIATIIALYKAIAQSQNTGQVLICGRSLDSVYRNVFEPVYTVPELAALAQVTKYRARNPYGEIMGRRVYVVGANDSQAEPKIRGVTAEIVYVDEATVLPEPFFKQLLGRMSAPAATMFVTTNPDSRNHWLKTQYLDRLEELPDWARFRFTLDDNPALTSEYKNALKREYSGLWYQRFILGEWVNAEGAIYDMWNPDQHVIAHEDIPKLRDIIAAGIDYGTTNPTSCIILGITRAGQLVLLDEWRLDHSNRGHAAWTDAQQSRALIDFINQSHHPSVNRPPRWVFLDPAAASLKTQMYADGQRNILNADNHVTDGIKTVATGLSEGWLKVSNKCTGFINEVTGYAWDSKATLNGIDKPIKQDDHSLDAARYAIQTTRNIWQRHVNKYIERTSA